MKRALYMIALLCCGLNLAGAQTLADPTQPPPESRLLPAGESDAPAYTGPVLQSVLIGSHGREVAVIDGQTVRKGEKFKGAVLVHVGKNQVVLQNGRNKQVLTLFPDAAKKTAH
jgi:MSHA biogenesis protein MshK